MVWFARRKKVVPIRAPIVLHFRMDGRLWYHKAGRFTIDAGIIIDGLGAKELRK
jgi:hypothetical protein